MDVNWSRVILYSLVFAEAINSILFCFCFFENKTKSKKRRKYLLLFSEFKHQNFYIVFPGVLSRMIYTILVTQISTNI